MKINKKVGDGTNDGADGEANGEANSKNNKKWRQNLAADYWQHHLWRQLLDKLAKSRSEKEIGHILENLLSKYEKQTILRRLAVGLLVQNGKSYRDIGRRLWIAPQTISAIKRSMSKRAYGYLGYQRCSDNLKSNLPNGKAAKSFWDNLFAGPDWDLKAILQCTDRPRGLGIMSAWDVREYRRKIFSKK